jgi:hypothetical protein
MALKILAMAFSLTWYLFVNLCCQSVDFLNLSIVFLAPLHSINVAKINSKYPECCLSDVSSGQKSHPSPFSWKSQDKGKIGTNSFPQRVLVNSSPIPSRILTTLTSPIPINIVLFRDYTGITINLTHNIEIVFIFSASPNCDHDHQSLSQQWFQF